MKFIKSVFIALFACIIMNIPVLAADNSYTVTVPASLECGQSGTVKVDGVWDGVLTVSCPDSLTLTNNLDGGTQDVNISLDVLSGANVGDDKSISSTVNIGEASGLFGEWSGSLVYSVDVEEYIPFTITSANRTKVGYSASNPTFDIPETFIENGVHYKVVAIADDALN